MKLYSDYIEEKFEITHENSTFEIDFAQLFSYYKTLNAKFLAEKNRNESCIYFSTCARTKTSI